MADASHFALVDADDGAAWLLTDFRRSIGATDPDAVFTAVDVATNDGEWAVLAADYELGACFDRAMVRLGASSPRLRGWVFGRAERLDADALERFLVDRLAELPAHDRVCGVADLVHAFDAASHAEKVEQIRRWISEGDCYQVNLTFPVDFTTYGHPLALYARLRARQPVRYGAFVLAPEAIILSFSPELFFERHGCRVVTRPMKGTAPRGATAEEDARNRAALLGSSKERAENVMIVDLLRNDLSRIAVAHSVRVPRLFHAEQLPTVWQMTSDVEARTRPGIGLADVFAALFPCGSITGAPKRQAMRLIRELEPGPRGIYCGAVGVVRPGSAPGRVHATFNVPIRTVVVRGDELRCGIGSGITADARAEAEWQEWAAKRAFLRGLG